MLPEESPDVEWVEHLSGARRPAVESALAEAARETRLFRHLKAEHDAEKRSHYIEIDAPLELFALVRLLRPWHVVEVGVSSGVSSAYLLQALDRNGAGTLHSVDLPKLAPKGESPSERPSWSLPAGRSSGWAVPFGLRGRWDLRLGNKRDVLPLLAEELPEVGLFVYDVPHDDRTSGVEFRRLDGILTRHGVAIVDHGPGGGLCRALRHWARTRDANPAGRRGTGLYGFRAETAAATAGA